MTLLFRIIYAAHCNGTHHKLAMDALTHLEDANRERWQKLFLAHATRYLEGSKAPDTVFKDFKNHVLHVRDNFWGGAPEKANEWYGKLVASLQERNWEKAVYSAGVLSHYYTDPVQPFHTAQTEAENTIHRAAEWSISKSYGELRKLADQEFRDLDVAVADSEYWLTDMVRKGAEFSNRYYEALIAHYNFDEGVVDPPAGLNDQSRRMLAELLTYASTGFARILDRAFRQAGVEPPDTRISAETVIASLQIPLRWVTNKIEDVREKRLVQRIYDELQATGRVEENLPEDERVVRDLHRKEVLLQAPNVRDEDARNGPAADDAPAERQDEAGDIGADDDGPEAEYRLSPSCEVEKAPSIGRKTADRLAKAGILTVANLIEADPAKVADELKISYISEEAISDWQDQARLACLIPGLLGSHAQLLVGCDYRHLGQIAEADPHELLGDIIQFGETKTGQRLVRSGYMPELEDIVDWIDHAKHALRAKAA